MNASLPLQEQMKMLLNEHPAYNIIEPRIEGWVSRVSTLFTPDQALFHTQRACGFGGSDQGTLISNFLNESDSFQSSARKIIQGKLLMSIPDLEDSEGALARGHAMEPQIRAQFQRLFRAETIDEAKNFLASARSSNVPCMRYSPDDVAALNAADYPGIPNKHNRKHLLVLVDYKAPTQVQTDAYGTAMVSRDYKAQLHSGNFLARENGLELDAMILVQFDYSQFKPLCTLVPFQQDLEDLMVQANVHYWGNYVNKGLLPDLVNVARPFDLSTLPEEEALMMTARANRFAMLSRLADEVSKLADAERAAFESRVIESGLQGPAKLKFDFANFSVDTKLNEDALKTHLISLGSNPSSWQGQGKELDQAKVSQYLKEQGMYESFLVPAYSKDKLLEDAANHALDVTQFQKYSFTARKTKKVNEHIDTDGATKSLSLPDLPEHSKPMPLR